jgi:hypothetical protein
MEITYLQNRCVVLLMKSYLSEALFFIGLLIIYLQKHWIPWKRLRYWLFVLLNLFDVIEPEDLEKN